MLYVCLCVHMFVRNTGSVRMHRRNDIVDKKCIPEAKSFAKSGSSIKSCAARCRRTPGCRFVSLRQDGRCIGCKVVPSAKYSNTKTYQIGTSSPPSFELCMRACRCIVMGRCVVSCASMDACMPAADNKHLYVCSRYRRQIH